MIPKVLRPPIPRSSPSSCSTSFVWLFALTFYRDWPQRRRRLSSVKSHRKWMADPGKICETKAHPREYTRRCTRDTLSPAYVCMRAPLLRIEKRWLGYSYEFEIPETIRNFSYLLLPRNITNELNDLQLTLSLIWIEILSIHALSAFSFNF